MEPLTHHQWKIQMIDSPHSHTHSLWGKKEKKKLVVTGRLVKQKEIKGRGGAKH